MDAPIQVVTMSWEAGRLACRFGREVAWAIEDKRDPDGAEDRNAVGGKRYKLRSEWAKTTWGRFWKSLPPDYTFDPTVAQKYIQQKNLRAYMDEISCIGKMLCKVAEDIADTIQNNPGDFPYQGEILRAPGEIEKAPIGTQKGQYATEQERKRALEAAQNKADIDFGNRVNRITDIHNRMQEKNSYRLKIEEAYREASEAIDKQIWMIRVTGKPDVKTAYEHKASGFLGKILGLSIEGEPYIMGRGKMRQTGDYQNGGDSGYENAEDENRFGGPFYRLDDEINGSISSSLEAKDELGDSGYYGQSDSGG